MAEVYVDPSIAADSGTGAIGDPFGDLQYALNNTTQGASGDRFNIKAGTDEVLTAALSLTTYGAPDYNKPLIIQGYTSAAGDGGIGGISGGGTYSVYSGAHNWIVFADLHLHNCGSANILDFSSVANMVIGCEIDNTTGIGIDFNVADRNVAAGCYLHNIGGLAAVWCAGDSVVYRCFIDNTETNKPTTGIQLSAGGKAIGNFIRHGNTTAERYGITINSGVAVENTIVATVTTGGNSQGISVQGAGDFIANNYIEGFASSGNKGIGNTQGNITFSVAIGNAAYNNAANYDTFTIGRDNDTLAGSGVVSTSDLDPAASAVTGMHEDAWPQSWPGLTTSTAPKADKGASQAGAGAGGASIYRRVARILGG